jgi:hypothetical protein
MCSTSFFINNHQFEYPPFSKNMSKEENFLSASKIAKPISQSFNIITSWNGLGFLPGQTFS